MVLVNCFVSLYVSHFRVINRVYKHPAKIAIKKRTTKQMRFFLSGLPVVFQNLFNIPSHLFQIVLHGRELLHGSVKYGLVQLDCVNLLVLVFQFGFYTRAPVRQRLDPCDVVKVLDVH